MQAELKIADSTRVEVRFRQQLTLMRQVQQSTPAWLDITVLDQQLRICRGNAGTTFALLRRNDLNLRTFLGV